MRNAYICWHVRGLNKRSSYNRACQLNNILHNLHAWSPNDNPFALSSQKTKAWAVVWTEWSSRGKVRLNLSPLRCGSGRGAEEKQAQALTNSYFPASKSPQFCCFSCPGSCRRSLQGSSCVKGLLSCSSESYVDILLLMDSFCLPSSFNFLWLVYPLSRPCWSIV